MINKESILSEIRNHRSELFQLGVQHIGLFGSYARDEQSHLSDIDILVDLNPEHENFDNYMALCDYLESLFKNQKVEVVTTNGLSPYIGPSIMKEVLYA